MDLACTLALVVSLVLLAGAYFVRVARHDSTTHARVEAEGRSALLSKRVMEMLAWGAEPIVDACVRRGISPDAVTYASLAFGFAAGAAFATGHFGLGALLGAIGSGGDAVDGLLARRLGVASPAGEVLDAAIDRYVDFFLLAGLAVCWRAYPISLVLVLLALLGTFMVSYSTAKADALHVEPPRGSMRRVERCVLVIGAAAITPVLAELAPDAAQLPLLAAISAIAVFGNASAVRRLASIRSSIRRATELDTAARAAAREAAE
jgi:phosphatidylglycerophosphate synthase